MSEFVTFVQVQRRDVNNPTRGTTFKQKRFSKSRHKNLLKTLFNNNNFIRPQILKEKLTHQNEPDSSRVKELQPQNHDHL